MEKSLHYTDKNYNFCLYIYLVIYVYISYFYNKVYILCIHPKMFTYKHSTLGRLKNAGTRLLQSGTCFSDSTVTACTRVEGELQFSRCSLIFSWPADTSASAVAILTQTSFFQQGTAGTGVELVSWLTTTV